jgi:hypothetical protein
MEMQLPMMTQMLVDQQPPHRLLVVDRLMMVVRSGHPLFKRFQSTEDRASAD